MSDDRYHAVVLARLDDLREDVVGVRSDLSSLRQEVSQAYALDADCIGRHSRETEARADGLKRVWSTLNDHDARIAAVERDGLQGKGERRAWTTAAKWASGILAGVLVGLLVGYLRGRMGG
jgi:hypothetical protein